MGDLVMLHEESIQGHLLVAGKRMTLLCNALPLCRSRKRKANQCQSQVQPDRTLINYSPHWHCLKPFYAEDPFGEDSWLV
jgi:hypothetical protein